MSIGRDKNFCTLDLLFNLWSTVDKLMTPELKLWVLDKFNKRDQ